MENSLPTADRIRNKGKHIKSLREGGVLIAQLWKLNKTEWVINSVDAVFTRDFDNEDGITAAIFPYKFNSQSLFRAMRNKRKNQN